MAAGEVGQRKLQEEVNEPDFDYRFRGGDKSTEFGELRLTMLHSVAV